jgi:diguanylate cyclase
MKMIDSLGNGISRLWRRRWRDSSPALSYHGPALIDAETDDDPMHDQDQHAAEEELARIADDAQRQLALLEALIGRSQDDAQDFGSALQDNATKLTDQGDAKDMVASLIGLTNIMIAKTRVATDELRSRREEMRGLRESLHEARVRADTDMLTKLANRRAFERCMATEVERAMTDHIPLTLAICDLDHFKEINDQFGHQTGDGVLKLVAKILTETCSRDGSVFRLGGEEFAIVFPALCEADAFRLVDQVRKDLEARKIRQRGTGEFLGRVTLSAGIATHAICNAQSAEQLFSVADRQLYVAKEAGRNQISAVNVGVVGD